jgi:hypothetical protein
MNMIRPSNPLPFLTIVLGVAITALFGDGAGVAALKPIGGRVTLGSDSSRVGADTTSF